MTNINKEKLVKILELNRIEYENLSKYMKSIGKINNSRKYNGMKEFIDFLLFRIKEGIFDIENDKVNIVCNNCINSEKSIYHCSLGSYIYNEMKHYGFCGSFINNKQSKNNFKQPKKEIKQTYKTRCFD